jgi:hypothetical protein
VTPFEKCSGIKPSFGHIRTFGCIKWVHNLDDRRKKLDAKCHACIMMGYSEESKYYSLFDPIK